MDKILKNQYDQIIKQLVILQDCATMNYFPYTSLGDTYIQRHLQTIEFCVDGIKSIESDEARKVKLKVLQIEARNFRLGEKTPSKVNRKQLTTMLEDWSSKWCDILESQFQFGTTIEARQELGPISQIAHT
ncbi:MAG: hypothetical protein QG670_2208 [Thermoproteota archaeon]|nr:hypothetical protein [Thermoproteota archaeon]